MTVNPIALTHWRLFKRGSMMPALLLFGGGAALAVIGGLYARLSDGDAEGLSEALLGWQMLVLACGPPLIAATSLARARQAGTLATDRNSPLRPSQLMGGYVAATLTPVGVLALPGVIALAVLALGTRSGPALGWFVAQALAASTGALMALCATVGLLVARNSRTAIFAGGVLAMMATVMGFTPMFVTGLITPAALMSALAFDDHMLRGHEAAMFGFVVLTQVVTAVMVWGAGLRALDPRRDRDAMRPAWLALLGGLWAIQLSYSAWIAHSPSLGSAPRAGAVASAIIPVALVLVLGSSVDGSAWTRALRGARGLWSASLVPFAAAASALFAVGITASSAIVSGGLSGYHNNPLPSALGVASSLIALAALADATTVLPRRTQRLLIAALTFGLGVLPLMVGLFSDSESIAVFSLFAALPGLISGEIDHGENLMAASTAAGFAVCVAFAVRHHALSLLRRAPTRVVSEG